ncbi:PREDICTED: smoothelin-like, partial [Amphimedon queenslandica]|uniref:Calponin-homology (CH) domain-containing protein n=1 Tax=Amphimedon queenslandica TaxID=400682 RepID=A0A1X7SXH1_AMPQE
DSEGYSPVSSPVHPSSSTADEPTINKSSVVAKSSVSSDDNKQDNNKSSLVAKSSVSSDDGKQDNPPPEDSYEARREARRRERELKKKEEPAQTSAPSTASSSNDTITSSTAEDSYEARREARRKAREERLKNMADSEPKMSYRERKEKEEAKRRQERSANKQKWAEMDQANGGNSERSFTRQKSSSGQQQLLAWCQHKTRYYENVDVKDFSNSWRDGLALCAILHNFVPELIPYDDLSPSNARENYTVALKAAEDAGLERFFDVDDIIAAGSPDPKSMMTFLATIYSYFK